MVEESFIVLPFESFVFVGKDATIASNEGIFAGGIPDLSRKFAFYWAGRLAVAGAVHCLGPAIQFCPHPSRKFSGQPGLRLSSQEVTACQPKG
jgi:hypothetical protein